MDLAPEQSRTCIRLNGMAMASHGSSRHGARCWERAGAAAVLIAVLTPTNAAGLAFWSASDAQKRSREPSAFLADVAIIGGLLRIVEEELTAIRQASRPSTCALPPEFAEEHDDASCDGHVE